MKVPDDVMQRTTGRIERYADENFKGQYVRLGVRFRGQFCYVDAFTDPGPNVVVGRGESKSERRQQLLNIPTKMHRLRYFGDEDAWSMAFFGYGKGTPP